jgi:ATP-binding cassette subfamily F protein 3
MTSHDREFMTRITNRTVEVASGAITAYPGDYELYLRKREVLGEQLVASYNRQQAMLEKENKLIAGLGARASRAAQVQSRIKAIYKIEKIALPPDPKPIKFRLTPARLSQARYMSR